MKTDMTIEKLKNKIAKVEKVNLNLTKKLHIKLQRSTYEEGNDILKELGLKESNRFKILQSIH